MEHRLCVMPAWIACGPIRISWFANVTQSTYTALIMYYEACMMCLTPYTPPTGEHI